MHPEILFGSGSRTMSTTDQPASSGGTDRALWAAPAGPTLRLLSWNILHGGSSRRLPHIALELVSHVPDVVVISEFRPRLGGQILAVLEERGLGHVATAAPDAAPGRNRTLIASRWPLLPVEGVGPEVMPACLARRVLVRRVETALGGLLLTAAHLPDDWTPSDALHGWAWLVRHAVMFRAESHMIVGDLNGSRDRGQPGGPPRHVAHAMGRLETAGYADAFGLGMDASGGGGTVISGPETTWKSHWGHELRLDHAWASASIVGSIVGARYAHQARVDGVSDHSAVLVELSLGRGSGAMTGQKCGKNHEKTGIEPMCRPCQTASGAIESRGSRRESKLFKE